MRYYNSKNVTDSVAGELAYLAGFLAGLAASFDAISPDLLDGNLESNRAVI